MTTPLRRVLVACEESATVREKFKAGGWDAWSCDLLPSRVPGQHVQGDVVPLLAEPWDLVIAFPPCTRLCCSGNRWRAGREEEEAQAVEFFMRFTRLECPWAIENPIGIMSSVYRKPDQIVQPWMFGHGEVKATCLWLSRLPLLVPSRIVEGREARVWKMPPSKDRARERSKTFDGLAQAMFDAWH